MLRNTYNTVPANPANGMNETKNNSLGRGNIIVPANASQNRKPIILAFFIFSLITWSIVMV
jgi:hypothetical protein